MKDEEEEKIKETRERYQGCFGCLGCGVVLGILLADLDPSKGRDIP